MSFEIQNFIVYGIVASVSYLLLGANLQWLLRKIFRQKPEIEDTQYLKLYRKSCADCKLTDLQSKPAIRKN
jgi:hypothetical protein